MSLDAQTLQQATEVPTPAEEPNPHRTFLHTEHFSSLNGVRCLCCLAVIKEHVKWNIPIPRLLNYGSLGVDMFFVISGFLIVTLIIRERERRGSVSLRNFYARRTLRIFPIYYLLVSAVFLVYVAVSPWRPNGLRYYLWTFPILLTYTQNVIPAPLGSFFHCWSLAAEEQFYVVWPTVERLAAGRLRWIVLFALLAVNQGLNFGLFNRLLLRIYGDPAALQLPIYIITFTPILLGVLLAYLLHHRGSFKAFHRLAGFRWAPIALVVLILAFGEVSPAISRGWPRLTIHLMFFLLLASLVIREDHFARPVLSFAPLARIGLISYGVYLYHVWVIQLLSMAPGRFQLLGPNRLWMFIVTSLVTIGMAELSFRWIERPLLQLKQRFHR